jgi:hypothetical protein
MLSQNEIGWLMCDAFLPVDARHMVQELEAAIRGR